MARTFRLFISSTFSDLEEERNALHERVFPELRRLCATHDARFQAIDLRWGVSDEAGLDQKTMPLCIGEIERCQKADRPNFLVLLGNRYGWRPLPAAIPASEFEQIVEVAGEAGRATLGEWFLRDDNAIPPEYYLGPRDPDGPFGTSRDEIERHQRSEAWEAKAAELGVILRSALEQISLDPGAAAKYRASATEQEIEVGALRVPDAADHVFCFFREIDGLPTDPSAAGYQDLEGSAINLEADAAQNDLKDRLRSALPDNVFESRVAWDSETGRPDLIGYLDRFCERVRQQLQGAIEARFAGDEARPSVEIEVESHRRFTEDRAAFFTGRTDVIEEIATYLTGRSSGPLLLHGVSGSGKSALLARAALLAEADHPGAEIVVRFVGATAGSSEGRSLLGDLCRQIGSLYGDDTPVSDDIRELTDLFPSRLALGTAERPLVVLIDALDQIAPGDPARRLAWLPAELPEHVRLVVSSLPGETLDAAASRSPHMLEVMPMPAAEAEHLLDAWLGDAGRTLQPSQRDDVLDAFGGADGLPLYLKLAFEEARLWRSREDHPPLAPDVAGLIRGNLFARLSDPSNHGELLVSRSLGYLAASRYGLAEDEILDALSRDEDVFESVAGQPYHDIPTTDATEQRLPVVVWARLYSDLEPYLTERNADGTTTLDFYHRQFRETATAAYLQEEAPARHSLLADLFRAKVDPDGNATWTGEDVRGLGELPFHLVEAERLDDVYEVLTDFRFMERKVAEVGVVEQADGTNLYTGVSRLRSDFDLVLGRMAGSEGDETRNRVILTAADFGDGLQIRCPHCNQTWPFDQNWRGRDIDCPGDDCGGPLRINPFVVGEPSTGPAAEPKDRPRPTTPDPPKEKPVSAVAGQSAVRAAGMPMAVTNNGTLITGHDGGRVEFWEAGSDTARRVDDAHTAPITAVAVIDDGPVAVTGSSDGVLRLWDLDDRAPVAALELPTGITSLAIGPGARVAVGLADGSLRVWDIETDPVELDGHDDAVTAVAVLADGSVASGSGDLKFRHWNPDTGELLESFKGHPAAITAIGAGASDPRVAWGCADTRMFFWDPASGDSPSQLKGNPSPTLAAAVGIRPLILSAAEDGIVRAIDLQAKKIPFRREYGVPIVAGALSPNGTRGAVCGRDGTLHRFEIPT